MRSSCPARRGASATDGLFTGERWPVGVPTMNVISHGRQLALVVALVSATLDRSRSARAHCLPVSRKSASRLTSEPIPQGVRSRNRVRLTARRDRPGSRATAHGPSSYRMPRANSIGNPRTPRTDGKLSNDDRPKTRAPGPLSAPNGCHYRHRVSKTALRIPGNFAPAVLANEARG